MYFQCVVLLSGALDESRIIFAPQALVRLRGSRQRAPESSFALNSERQCFQCLQSSQIPFRTGTQLPPRNLLAQPRDTFPEVAGAGPHAIGNSLECLPVLFHLGAQVPGGFSQRLAGMAFMQRFQKFDGKPGSCKVVVQVSGERTFRHRRSLIDSRSNSAGCTTHTVPKQSMAEGLRGQRQAVRTGGKMTPEKILAVARGNLGFEDLRPGQRAAIEAVLEGHDTLVVQPTGSGKSAIYQIAGLLIEGSTVIVSPLIALQKDQVDSIREQNSAEAVALNSRERVSDFRGALERIRKGSVEYIFLAPEQLRKPETMETLDHARISLFVVDEAHCISHWGHDFRPDYLRLGHVIESLGHPRVLALTATASRDVREEIVHRLRMRRPKIFVRGFNRPNIVLRVDHFETESEKRRALIHRVLWADKPGIVYTGTRRAAEELVQDLNQERIKVLLYHGGLGARERESIQDQFMSGGADVIVATNAFGMGVDKPDIRFVFHHDPPESLDSYYQEIGRAGRDGKRSDAELFYRAENIGSQSFKSGEGVIGPAVLEAVANRIQAEEPVTPGEIAEEAGLSPRRVALAIQGLEDAGAVETEPDGEVAVIEDADLHEAALMASEDSEKRRNANRRRLREVQEYAESTGCRREFLLRRLGDEFSGPCGSCDNCEAPEEGVRREVT